jgi:hypothetical protein
VTLMHAHPYWTRLRGEDDRDEYASHYHDRTERTRSGFLGRHPFAMFLTLTFGIPILLVGSLLLTPQIWSWVHGGPFDYFAEFERLTGALGLVNVPRSSLYLWLRLSLAEPIFWTGNIYVAAPAIAALIADQRDIRRERAEIYRDKQDQVLALGQENAKLKRLVSELSLEKLELKDIAAEPSCQD